MAELSRRLRDSRDRRGPCGVHLPGVGLPRDRERRRRAQLLGNAPLELVDLGAVAVGQREERGLGPGRPLDPAQAEAGEAEGDLVEVEEEVLDPEAGALPHGRRLRGLEVGPGEGGEIGVPLGELRQRAHHTEALALHHPHRALHDEEVAVVDHEGAGRAKVEHGASGRRDLAEGAHVGHDIVAELPLELGGAREVDPVGVPFEVRHLLGGHAADPELTLGVGEGDPDPAPRADPRARREQAGHLVARVPLEERARVAVVGVCHQRSGTPRISSRPGPGSGAPDAPRWPRRRCPPSPPARRAASGRSRGARRSP